MLSTVSAPGSLGHRRRRTDGERTHAAILETATKLASIEGVDGLTVGRLAEELGVSKSGVYAHFGSKRQLQLEVIEAALSIFEREVIRPSSDERTGMRRLEALCEAFLSYVERRVFPGGCFFASLMAEGDARAGAVHEAALESQRAFMGLLVELIRQAQAGGELNKRVDPNQLAFELHACLELANYHFVLFRDPEQITRGRKAVRRILRGARPRTSSRR